jgi:hypothetical protein
MIIRVTLTLIRQRQTRRSIWIGSVFTAWPSELWTKR